MSDILQQGEQFQFDARNPRPGFKVLKSGHIYTLNIELFDQRDWDILKNIPENAILDITLSFNDGDPVEPPAPVETHAEPVKAKKAKKEKPVKGEYGRYWSEMFARGFWAFRDLQVQMGFPNGDAKPEQIKEWIKADFEVSSLTFISPDDFEEWLSNNYHLHSLIRMSRQCEAKVATI